jgi:hypothetical protein
VDALYNFSKTSLSWKDKKDKKDTMSELIASMTNMVDSVSVLSLASGEAPDSTPGVDLSTSAPEGKDDGQGTRVQVDIWATVPDISQV